MNEQFHYWDYADFLAATDAAFFEDLGEGQITKKRRPFKSFSDNINFLIMEIMRIFI